MPVASVVSLLLMSVPPLPSMSSWRGV